jgi:hypothetical protein
MTRILCNLEVVNLTRVLKIRGPNEISNWIRSKGQKVWSKVSPGDPYLKTGRTNLLRTRKLLVPQARG